MTSFKLPVIEAVIQRRRHSYVWDSDNVIVFMRSRRAALSVTRLQPHPGCGLETPTALIVEGISKVVGEIQSDRRVCWEYRDVLSLCPKHVGGIFMWVMAPGI